MMAIMDKVPTLDMNVLSPFFVVSALALWIIYHFVCYIQDPLRSVPGPFLARFTRLWYLGAIWGQKFHQINIELHKKYGPIVRIAPNYYSIDDKDAIKTIYGLGTKFVKGEWYLASAPTKNVERDLFTERNPETHAFNRRKVAALYSMTSLMGMEPHVQQTTGTFITRLSEMTAAKTPLNLQVWLQYWAFDSIALITLYKSFGFLEEGGDKAGLISALHSFLVYSARVGVYAEWHSFLAWIRSFFPFKGIHYMGNFIAEHVAGGQAQREKETPGSKEIKPDDDFLTKCLRLHAQKPTIFTMDSLFTTVSANIIAGSDTTSISATAIMDCLICNPEKLNKLREEVDKTFNERQSTTPMLSFAETQKMPYLQACIREGMRLHPATGLPFVRVVPEGGSVLAGRYIPAKSRVGVNSWVAHANQDIWGPDAEEFRPERWLESAEIANELTRYFMSFGSGSRTCIGKNISLLEISIVVPELVRRFNFTRADPGEPLEAYNNWFVKQQNSNYFVALRKHG